jgi:ATP-dependent Clp protease ATP-binding subunit ClpA
MSGWGSPMLSNELEHCLMDAFLRARKAGHGHSTIEHLLLAILDSPNVCDVLRACRGDPVILKHELEKHLDESTPPRFDGYEGRELPRTLEVQPTLGLQRVLQRAVFYVKSSDKKEVGVADVLVAIFSEKQSHAVCLLNRHNITRLDVVNYISHSLTLP